MKTIPVMKRDKETKVDRQVAVALVDDEDFDLVSGRRWGLHSDGYATSSRILMHRLILGLPKVASPEGLHTDHIDRNRLNNQRDNLRAVTQAVNNQNLPCVGVGKLGKRWRAWSRDGVHLGVFDTEEEAHEAVKAYTLTGTRQVNPGQHPEARLSPCCSASIVRNGMYRGVQRFRCSSCLWTFKETAL